MLQAADAMRVMADKAGVALSVLLISPAVESLNRIIQTILTCSATRLNSKRGSTVRLT